jgi:hypothetical protein
MMLRNFPACIAAALPLCAVLSAVPQKNVSLPDNFPFSVWIEHKEVTQIPWTFTVTRPVMRTDFRQELRISASFRPGEQQGSSEMPDLALYARVLENGRAISPVHTVLARDPQKGPEQSDNLPEIAPRRMHYLQMTAIVRPGKYRLELAVLDRGTGRYNTRFENITVSGNPKDLIERSFAGFSKFEFAEISRTESSDDLPLPVFGRMPLSISLPIALQSLGRGVRFAGLAGSDFAVSAASPRFVIDSPGALKLTIFSVLSPPESALEIENARNIFHYNLVNLLSALMRFDVVNGSADLFAVDLEDRSRKFDRIDLKDVQREALRSAIGKDRSAVSLKDLAGRPDSGKFLRDALAERLREAAADTSGAKHAIVIVGARAVVPGTRNLEPIPAVAKCHCKIFYVRFAVTRRERDDMTRLISAHSPRIFEPLTWAQFRDQFATIYQQLLQ